MNNVDNLILEHLKAIRAAVDRLEHEMKEVKGRLTNVESTLIGGRRDVILQEENIFRQQISIDRLAERLNRVEKRLELSDQ